MQEKHIVPTINRVRCRHKAALLSSLLLIRLLINSVKDRDFDADSREVVTI